MSKFTHKSSTNRAVLQEISVDQNLASILREVSIDQGNADSYALVLANPNANVSATVTSTALTTTTDNNDEYTFISRKCSRVCIDRIEEIEKIYTWLDTSTQGIPLAWDYKNTASGIRLSHRDEVAENVGNEHARNIVVRTAYPVPYDCVLYYFEIEVIVMRGNLIVGVSDANLNYTHGYGEFSDYLIFYDEENDMYEVQLDEDGQSAEMQEGDVIGCIVNFISRTIHFTHNGNLCHKFYRDLPPQIFPSVTTNARCAMFRGNFGQRPFKFDFMRLVNATRRIHLLQPRFYEC